MNTRTLRPAQFTLADDDGPLYTGFTDGRTWNGYAWPRFTREVAAQVVADIGGTYDANTDTFCVPMDDDLPGDCFTGAAIEGMHLYDFQQHGWTWTQETNESVN